MTNGNVYINSVENGAVTSSHKISGSGATTVTTDANGNIVISSTDNNTTYDAAGSALGLVKSGGDVTISSGVITINDDSHNHTISNIDNLQSSLDAKQATVTGGASTITSSNLTVSRALVSDGSGKVAVSAVTSTEIGYLDGVTSNVQTQLDGKSASTHNHGLLHTNLTQQLDNTTTDSGWSMLNDTYNGFILKTLRTQQNAPSWTQGNYAAGIAFGGADTKGVITQAYNSPSITFAGGNGDKPVWWIKTTGTTGTTYNLDNMPKSQSADKLNTNAGDSNTPVYFSNGKPVACTSLDLNTTGSAAKLTTARSIGLGNDLTGSANFDGSGNITISAKHYNATVNSGNKSNYPYHRFAYKGSKASAVTSQYTDADAIFLIRERYYNGGYGILKVSLRTNASGSVSTASAIWLVRYNIELDDVQIGLYNTSGATYADIYIKVGTYARTVITQLEGDRSWTLVSSNEVNDTTTSDSLTSEESYASISSAATKLHGQSYSSIISSVDGGKVNYANSAGSATSATTATNVAWSGVTSKPSYYDAKAIKGITRSGTTFTYTCMDGTTGTFTQQDNNTTYNVVTTSANGLMSAADKAKLDTIELATLAEVKTYLGI